MRELLINICFMTLALTLVFLKGIAWLILAPVVVGIKLYELIRYEAQCLRYPPPPEGVFGAMGKAQRERECQDLTPGRSDRPAPPD